MHPEPGPLLTEYLARDGRGELLGSGGKWFAAAVECPGHVLASDVATIVGGWRVVPLSQGTNTARYVVEFRALGQLTEDDAGPYVVSKPGVERDTVVLVRKPYGWRIGKLPVTPHVLPAAVRAGLQDPARRATLDSLVAAQASPR